MPTLNYTTTVPVARTVGEVQAVLVEAGADAVGIKYTDRLPVGLSFILSTPHGERSFDLPVNIDGVQRLLTEQYNTGKIRGGRSKMMYTSPEHAARVAWRILKDWLEAQLAIIKAEMVTLDQVMLPYLRVTADSTLYDLYRTREQQALEVGTGG